MIAFVFGVFLTGASAQTAARDTIVNVFFANDRYGLGKESLKMDSVARLLMGDASDSKVTLYGYASNCGTVQYNRRLVDLRLLTVKHALMRRGVDESRIQLIVNNGIDRTKAAKYARRVELAFTLPGAKEPADTPVPDVPAPDTLGTDTLITDTLLTDTPVTDCVADSSLFTLHSSLKDSSLKDSSLKDSSLFTLHSSLSCPRLALRTNLLYDLAVVPNVGVEWFADEHWSVAANVMYIWMKSDMRHRYWRLFSTDVEGRYWLTPQTCDVRTGHHFGLYAGFYRYDFEFGDRGWMGDANYGGGLSYGYALRLFPKWKERFTLDMSLGFGYLGGTHKEYIPDDGCYVWQRTVRHHLFIPTKAEVTLVWYPRWPFFNRKGTAQ